MFELIKIEAMRDHFTAECSLMRDLLVFITSVVSELLETSAVSFFRTRGERIINTIHGLHHCV